MASGGVDDPGFNSVIGYYLGSPSERARNVSERLQDLGARRLADMDAAGIDMQIVSLTSRLVIGQGAVGGRSAPCGSGPSRHGSFAACDLQRVSFSAAAPSYSPSSIVRCPSTR